MLPYFHETDGIPERVGKVVGDALAAIVIVTVSFVIIHNLVIQ
jgi:hypothetical protein